MIDVESRVGRVILRARHLGWGDDAVRDLAAALRGAEVSAHVRAEVEHAAPRAAGAMLALAFGGEGDAPDATERAALSLAKSDRIHVMLVGVSGGPETPEEIAELADVVVRSTEEALEGLETVARALGV